MIWLLRLLFIGILVTMSALIGWASWQQPIFGIPAEVRTNPWFIATLFDAYFAFITFYVWVAWKEPTIGARILWFITVILWGNFAMAIYLLIELFRIKDIAQLREVIATPRDGRLRLPLAFVITGALAYALGAGPLFS
ncbi:DUF1475 family protein [Synoicihabitans lomoniglobus]|uniref:DUF1475 family protein n=1 Tax=Synoicihabitans lomoniglobus TaxID=2909285 RepID=A0AAF0CMY9_9BACT|nr:DUF1475 domain-containing protein [Opitutaceae bacterium LMO-M01]WED63951.1 DUF1475 family protein [Opitutaceae bacterium LMO-M01]